MTAKNQTQKRFYFSNNFLLAMGFVVVLSLAYMLVGKQNQTNPVEKLIVQGASQTSMKADVESVGGKVLHSFKVINAIAVALTKEQQQQLTKQSPLLSLFANADVELGDSSKAAPQSRLKFDVKKAKVSWATKINSNTTISHIEASWPQANGLLKSLKINGKKLVSDHQSAWVFYQPANADQIKLKPGLKIQLRFAQISSVSEHDYKINVVMVNGDSYTFSPADTMAKQGKKRDTHYANQVRANEVHQSGVTGKGVTVAIIDSGLTHLKNIGRNGDNSKREIYTFNVLEDNKAKQHAVNDDYGHGTHIASVISDNSHSYHLDGTKTDSYNGIAPNADLLVVKAFNGKGESSYIEVLKAIEYVVDNAEKLNIQVLNLSFSAQPSSFYWQDPINQALMVAWDAGITVVASAGNSGSDAMSIGVPGNNPYVITVGALSDSYTVNDTSDDFVASFSSAGPTYSAFVKPELVAPGGHIQGVIGKKSYIAKNFPMYNTGHNYYQISGTSQSAAVTSGIVALLLEAQPGLTPDEVKCHLLNSAKQMLTNENELTYSVFQQGAGLVDAVYALENTSCAPLGMDIAKDIADEEHYMGPARYDEDTDSYYIVDADGYVWDGIYTDGALWRSSRRGGVKANGALWRGSRRGGVKANGALWRGSRRGGVKTNGALWRGSRRGGVKADTSINTSWVNQE